MTVSARTTGFNRNIVRPHIILLHKLARAAHVDAEGAQHPLTLTQIRFLPLLVLNVNIERFAFEEEFQIAVVLEGRMGSRFVKHLLQRSPARFDEVALESADGLLIGRRRNNHAGVVGMQGVIQPKKVAVPTLDLKFGLLVSLGRRLPRDQSARLPHAKRFGCARG